MSGIRIPADVDREDRLLAGLSGRQLLELLVSGLGFLLLHGAVSSFLPLAASAAIAGPWIAVTGAVVLGRRDGLPADRFLLSALHHRLRPRLLAPFAETPPPVPAGCPAVPAVAPLQLPAQAVRDDGVVDLGAAGSALLCRASSVNFALRTPDEQAALVEVIGSWLNSLAAPVQIVARAERVDVASMVTELEERSRSLPHPDLEAAAREHGSFLLQLAARRDILRREVLVVFRDAASPEVAASTLWRRADDAVEALAAAGIVLTPLGRSDALSTLARAADPDAPASDRTLGWIADDDVVRGTL